MTFEYPTEGRIPELKALWVEAFGEEAFWDGFFRQVFSPDHCRCVTEGTALAAALFWLDCGWEGRRIAYLYAVATGWDFRGRGLCRGLLSDTHALLEAQGYAGAMLVPGSDALRRMYEKMGYRTCTTLREFTCPAGDPIPVRRVDRDAYAALRRRLLPPSGVVQEGKNLDLLESMAELFAGEDFVAAAFREGDVLHVLELLGDGAAAPSFVGAMGCSRGRFRMPGGEKAFAMFRPFRETRGNPQYFGLAFD